MTAEHPHTVVASHPTTCPGCIAVIAIAAETGRTSEWEPLYRAEKSRADAAEAAVARVRALHQPLECRDPAECAHCTDTADWQYPCSTIQSLDAP
jgi:hypothetical protein